MLENLNVRQKEATTCTDGPLLVLAGAGSGKTRVLTTRIAYLVLEKKVSPYQVLAITFTNKAAKEMKERVRNLLGNVSYQIQISTFHSFGLSILKEHCDKVGLTKNFTIIDSDDSLAIIKKIIKEMNLDSKIYSPKQIKNQISGAKNEMMDYEEYSKYANTLFEEKVIEVYKRYQNRLKNNNSVDFDDLLIMPIKLFQNYPSILKEYQERFKYILIDEYQDTNEAQYILTKMISAKYKNICVVGDNDQSIYSFRGANYHNILNFEKDYPNAKVIMLEENYRSTKNILNVANDIIKNNSLRKDKVLWTNNDEGLKIKYFKTDNEKDEAFKVVMEVEKLAHTGIPLNEIAVLYRTNVQSRNLEEAFLKNNIPYKVIGSFYFYKRKEIKDLIAYLKLIYNPKDDSSLLRVINVPKRKIGIRTIENIQANASLNNTCMFDAITGGKELEFKNLICNLMMESEKLTLTELVDYILDKTGMRQELELEKTLEAESKIEHLEEFKSITRNFEENNGIISLEAFLDSISLVSDIEEMKNNDNVVTLMTIHSSKGLEFDNVFITGLEEGIFPHINSFQDKEELEEERRLCYVAVTRARKNLYLLNARKRTIYGESSYNLPSRFIDEINDDYLEIEGKIEVPTFDKEKLIDETAEYNLSEKVVSTVYGEGVIVGVENNVLTIAFAHPVGIKKIIKGHKSIRKV